MPQSRQRTSRAPAKRDDLEQSKLFIEKAREIGADEDKSAADDLMGRLAKIPPEPRKPIKKNEL
jgi:hypothetical protein